MEPLPATPTKILINQRPGLFARLVIAAGMVLCGISGCIPESFLAQSNAATNIPCRIAMRWDHDVHFPADTLAPRGKPLPTIAGRVTLFAEDLTTPVVAEGTIIVYMYDDMPDAPNKTEVLEAWILDTKTVHKLQRRDAAGLGYTLILPWQMYRPDLTHVKLQVRFDRVGAEYPLYSDLIPVTFESATDTPRVVVTQKQSTTIVPGKGMVTQSQTGGNSGPGNTPTANAHAPAVDESRGGLLPTTITKSPPPPLGSDIPFIVPGREALPRQ